MATGAGLVAAVAAIVGLSLSVLQSQEAILAQSASVQPIEAGQAPALAQANGSGSADSAIGQAKPETYLVLGDLKLSDQLGKKD